jgi:hypothetical protein
LPTFFPDKSKTSIFAMAISWPFQQQLS